MEKEIGRLAAMPAIVFSSDDNFAMLLGVALCSLFENKKGDYPVAVFVLDGAISKKNKERLHVLEKRYGFKINYIVPPPEWFDGISTDARPTAAYYRTALAELLPPSCRKVIYVDTDVLIEGDLREMFELPLHGNIIGAVPDSPQEERIEHLKKTVARLPAVTLSDRPVYFNSGVMIIDVEKWREHAIGQTLLRFIKSNPETLFFADQDPLNIILNNQCELLPRVFNFIPEAMTLPPGEKPHVVHFAGGLKPWYVLSALPYQHKYVRYANMTPWKRVKYRKIMDVPFAKKYRIYAIAWGIWSAYKRIKKALK